VQVLHRLNGEQSSSSFEDFASATRFQKLVDKFDLAKAVRLSACTGAEGASIASGRRIDTLRPEAPPAKFALGNLERRP